MSNPVSIVQIGDLIQTKNDKSKQLQSGEYLQYGVLPIVDQGAKHICGYTNDLSKSYDKGFPVVVFGDHTLHTKFIDFNFAIGADGTQVLGPKSKECDTKYLYYLVSRAAELIGSEGYKRHFKILKEFDIEYIEPLPEQQKIATILSSVDDVIEKTRAQIDKLKDLKTGMMQELLTKGIGHTEFKDSPVGRIPVSWNALSVGDLISSGILESIQDGNHGEKHPKSSDYVPDGIPFVMASDIHGQEIDVSGAHKIPEEIFQGLRIGFSKPGDVLLSHKATIGLTAIVPEHLKRLMLTPQVTYYRVSNKSKLLNHYLHYWFQSSVFQEMITALSAQSTRSYIGIKAQRELIVVMPSDIQEQEQLVDVLHSIDSRLKLVATKLALLIAKKKALMQDLLTGKVRVKLTDKESAVV